MPDENVSIHTLQLFHMTVAQSLYETEKKQDYSNASPKELEEILKGVDEPPFKNGVLLFETLQSSEVYLYSFDISTGLFISTTGNINDLPPAVIAKVYMVENDNFECNFTF